MPQSPRVSARILRRASFKTTHWRNGGGITHEAIRVPESGDAFRWRLSVAEIASSGPFSDFQGYRRRMALLRGAGLELHFADGERRRLDQIGDLVEFDGARRVHCELVAGPCVDLNLMVEGSMPDVRARVLSLRTPLPVDSSAGESLVIFAIAGSLVVAPANAPPLTLDPWDLAVVSHAESALITLQSASADAPAQVFLADLRDT
jgi:environmental stress-induced protein Ves